MSIDRADGNEDARAGATRLLARASAASGAARLRLQAAMGDFFLSEDGRLDDRLRARLAALVGAIVARFEDEIRTDAAHALADAPEAAASIGEGAPALDGLVARDMLRDDALLAELIGRVQLDHLADALPPVAPEQPDMPSLLTRLSTDGNSAIAHAAVTLLAAEGRRRGFADTGRLVRTELPAELHHRLLWRVAAAIRAGIADQRESVDHAIAAAATRVLADHDEGDSVEAAAMQLAAAIDPHPDELGELLLAALQDRRPAFAVAVLARAVRIDAATARALVIEPDIARLWLALRAAGLTREWIARIGLALADADPRRNADQLADTVDAAMTVTPQEADAAMASMRLPLDYVDALALFDRGSAR